jgi:hypothetical protein
LNKECDFCGGFDKDDCDALVGTGDGDAALRVPIAGFVDSFMNRLGDRQDFCTEWTLSDAHMVVQFRNVEDEGQFVRLTNWFEDRHSPFSEVYKPLRTVPGAVYTVNARVRVNRRDAEYFNLRSKPSGEQPCADGMVSVEHCPRHNYEEVWGCNAERSAHVESGNTEWSTVEFNFTAVVEVSYLIFKVRFDAPLLIDTVSVTDTGRRQTFDSPCACPANLEGSGQGFQVEEGGESAPETVDSTSPIADCIRMNCVESWIRCEHDDVCAHLFPQVYIYIYTYIYI